MIVWTDGAHGATYGQVDFDGAKVRIAEIHYSLTREPDGKMHALYMKLPGYPHPKRLASKEEAKALAERLTRRHTMQMWKAMTKADDEEET